MGYSSLFHTLVGWGPVLAAICGNGNAAVVSAECWIVSPHLESRQIVGPTECPPHEIFHTGIESNPVRCIAPVLRNPFGRRIPALHSIVALESTDVCVVDE